jgi:hypothetical protein
MESTYSVPSACPATTGSWILKQVGGGQIPTTSDPKTFSLGLQAEGGVLSGPPIGSTQQFVMCDAFNNCSPPFYLTIGDCQTKVDNLYVAYNTTLNVTQGERQFEQLEMTGPWVNSDAGINAQSRLISTNIPGATFSFGAGYTNGSTNCYPYGCVGLVDMTVAASLSTPPGDYQATVQVTDLASNVSRTTVAPIHVWACTPPPVCTPGDSCGVFSGCGRSVDCGSCSSGNSCSVGHCCPTGTIWFSSTGTCQPACHCPTGFYCDVNGDCQRNSTCHVGTCQ